MIRKGYIISFLLILFFSSNSFSQNSKNQRVIEWEISQKGVEKKYSFEHVFYKNETSKLPYYGEVIKLNSIDKDVKIKLVNQKFIALKKGDISDDFKAINISENIQVEQQMVYERKKPFLAVSFLPIRKNKNTGQLEKLTSFRYEFSYSNRKLRIEPRIYAKNSLLRSGKWVKIAIEKTGIHKITFEKLKELGFENPSEIRVFGYGNGMLSEDNKIPVYDDMVENKIKIGEDAIYFYAENSVKWSYNTKEKMYLHKVHSYSFNSHYFLTSGVNTGFDNKIKESGKITASANKTIDNYLFRDFHEEDKVNPQSTGREWYGETFSLEKTYSFDDLSVDNIIPNEEIKIQFSAAMLGSSAKFDVKINEEKEVVSVSNREIKREILLFTKNKNSNIKVQVSLINSSGVDEAWLNYICLNARRKLKIQGSQFYFGFEETINSPVVQFNLSNANSSIEIWNVSNPARVSKVPINLSGSDLNFKIKADSISRFVAFDGTDYNTPIFEGDNLGEIENQDLHSLGHFDFIIITPKEFLSQSEELAELYREKENLRTVVATNQQIYNEFSSGTPDIVALRNFAKMLYDRATTDENMPKYLLLFGDGSFDNKGIYNSDNNKILTYQNDKSFQNEGHHYSFCSDDFFGFLDDYDSTFGDTNRIDIGIGRYPAQSVEEANIFIEKEKIYKSQEAMGSWRNSVAYSCDDADKSEDRLYFGYIENIAKKTAKDNPELNIEKMYLDAFNQITKDGGHRYPDVVSLINRKMQQGLLYFAYIGHGGYKGVTDEQIFVRGQVKKWKNSKRFPVFFMASCDIAPFDQNAEVTIGEEFLTTPKGGIIALVSTTRSLSVNTTFDREFNEKVLKNKNTLGDAIRIAKNSSIASDNAKKYILLGNPALRLAIPKKTIKVVCNKFNNQAINSGTLMNDTIQALSKISISGYLTDNKGNKLKDFNGKISPAIFDKVRHLKTLNNDGNADPRDFDIQNSIIYKGNATVKNGEFSFSFIVPKDIAYNYGKGKMSYYIQNNNEDFHAMDSVTVGGINPTAQNDGKAPEVELYMNDENFVQGGVTDENPSIYAIITDESGVNSAGSGVGHDITAVLDDDNSQVHILNDAYEADLDSYQKGRVNYPLSDLKSGEHSLKLKVWDVFNNPSTTETDFIVAENAKLALKHVLNYPNPFTENTAFFFEHNYSSSELEVIIQIFTVSGKIVKTIETTVNTNGFRSNPIRWDGLDDYGDKIGRGVYLYRIKVKTPDGKKAEKIEKLVILK